MIRIYEESLPQQIFVFRLLGVQASRGQFCCWDAGLPAARPAKAAGAATDIPVAKRGIVQECVAQADFEFIPRNEGPGKMIGRFHMKVMAAILLSSSQRQAVN